MTIALPHPALSIAGFALAHAAWSVSYAEQDEPFSPLGIVEGEDGERRMKRYEAETLEQAITDGKVAMREAARTAAAWAFVREGMWGRMGSSEASDLLAVDFWSAGMPSTATIVHHFNRSSNGSRFRIHASPTLLIDGSQLSAEVASPFIAEIMTAALSHPIVKKLWPTWK